MGHLKLIISFPPSICSLSDVCFQHLCLTSKRALESFWETSLNSIELFECMSLYILWSKILICCESWGGFCLFYFVVYVGWLVWFFTYVWLMVSLIFSPTEKIYLPVLQLFIDWRENSCSFSVIIDEKLTRNCWWKTVVIIHLKFTRICYLCTNI